MLYVSRETDEVTHTRLLHVMAATRLHVFDESYTFEEFPAEGLPPTLGARTLAAVRDESVWSVLVPTTPSSKLEQFGLIRFHFPPRLDNSGFVGWLASHLKRTLGTGVFVVCGHNSAAGGIFDYMGFPVQLREHVLKELTALRSAGALLTREDNPSHS